MRHAGLIPLIVCALGVAVAAAPAWAGKKTEKAVDGFFGPEKLYTIHLHISPSDWELMQPTRRPRPMPLVAETIPAPTPSDPKKPVSKNSMPARTRQAAGKRVPVDGEKLPPNNFGFEYVYVKANFDCDGEKLGDVAIRFKGNSSYENYQRGPNRPYKLEFDRFVHGRTFHGLQTMNLGNNAFDLWQLREPLSFAVYRRAGVPAPRTAFAVVYLTVDGQYNRQFVGFYTIVEELDDKEFLKEQFGDAGGLLLKPEGIRGLPYMGENWAAYPQRYHSKTSTVDPELSRRFIDFVKLVNYADDATFKAKIGDYLAVGAFLRYLAASVLITNLDSPLVTNHNFYLYENPEDRKVWMMPWDMNLSFASYGATSEVFNLSISHPWAGENKLIARTLAIPEYERAYRAHLGGFIKDFFNDAGMREIAAPMRRALAKAEATANKEPDGVMIKGAPTRLSRGGGYSLETYVSKRIESVQAQLDGKTVSTFVPRQNSGAFWMRWGLRASSEFGQLPAMAAAIRRYADDDSDYKVNPREARDAVAALFYNGVSEGQPDSMDQHELTAALSPLLREFAPQSGRGLLGINWTGAPGAAGLWTTAIFRDADTNHDGRVTLDELTDLVSRIVCLADSDQDGALDEREVIEALDLLAAPEWTEPAPPARVTPVAPARRRR